MKIREMKWEDIGTVSELCGELGYTVNLDEAGYRFDVIRKSSDHALYVAESNRSEVAGWVHVAVNLSLTSHPRCEIIGLVVHPQFRRKGVGRTLVSYCEGWARAKGYSLIRVRSQALRESALEFYKGLGYELTKIQNVFVKELNH
jgi:ribosomal protein S18 acetylase RimI-like enzyme